MTPEVRFYGPVLAPEEIELVDEFLAPNRPPLEAPASVYVLALASGAAYVGIAADPRGRAKQHARNARDVRLLPPPGEACEIPRDVQPSEIYLALHGTPTLVAVVACPTRRHAHLYEALLTTQVAEAGVQVHGAGFDQTASKWRRNTFPGARLDDLAALAKLA